MELPWPAVDNVKPRFFFGSLVVIYYFLRCLAEYPDVFNNDIDPYTCEWVKFSSLGAASYHGERLSFLMVMNYLPMYDEVSIGGHLSKGLVQFTNCDQPASC